MGDTVIVIGAGAAGLVVARQLSRAGIEVKVVEARDRIGGRIHTFMDEKFTSPTEAGAEFIHGNLETTFKLLKEYNITYSPAKGQIWHVRSGELEKDRDFVSDHHYLLKKKLKALKKDVPIKKFLERNFPQKKYLSMWQEISGFVNGYESADMEKFSTFAFRKDWLESEEWDQYRIDGGYGKLINALEEDCKKNGCEFYFSTPVKKIKWKKNFVEATCDNKRFKANKVIIAVPLGILQRNKIKFSPAIPEKIKIVNKLGYGEVIKILFLFKSKFWENKTLQKQIGVNLDKLFFLFSGAPIPTWWTQHPSSSALLTGWLSGIKAKQRKNNSDNEIFEEALRSLAVIFQTEKTILKKELLSWKVFNWSKDDFSLGSYSYATVDANKHIKKLGNPVKDTIFFSGEIFSEGGGTVENALSSGFQSAEQVLVKR